MPPYFSWLNFIIKIPYSLPTDHAFLHTFVLFPCSLVSFDHLASLLLIISCLSIVSSSATQYFQLLIAFRIFQVHIIFNSTPLLHLPVILATVLFLSHVSSLSLPWGVFLIKKTKCSFSSWTWPFLATVKLVLSQVSGFLSTFGRRNRMFADVAILVKGQGARG